MYSVQKGKTYQRARTLNMWLFSAKSIQIRKEDKRELNLQLKNNCRPKGQFFFTELE